MRFHIGTTASLILLTTATTTRTILSPPCCRAVSAAAAAATAPPRGGATLQQTIRQVYNHSATTMEKTGREAAAATTLEDDELVVGGGAVNEKVRLFGKEGNGSVPIPTSLDSSFYDPQNVVSHALHTWVGLDRYPNYLSRWSMHDIHKFEQSLQAQLEKVQKARESIQAQRNDIHQLVQAFLHDNNDDDDTTTTKDSGSLSKQRQRLFQPPTDWNDLWERKILHPQAIQVLTKSKMMRQTNNTPPSLQDVLTGNTRLELDASQLEAWIDEELFDVYSFPLLSDEFCQELLSTLQDWIAWCHLRGDTHVGARNLDLDTLGLSWLSDLLYRVVLCPIARHLYRDTELQGGELDWRQAYVAGYSATSSAARGTPRQHLVSHTDDSEVTLNVCLAHANDFDGGDLQFWGLRQPDATFARQPLGNYAPTRGFAVVHAGRHLHQVTPVTRGERFVCILWARSWRHVRSQQCPCCWLNRRDADGSKASCICGARWN